MHHDVLLAVRGQLVGTGSLILSCGYQGWSLGGCSFQQVPLPAEPSGSDAWSSTQASCLFNDAPGSLECLRYPVPNKMFWALGCVHLGCWETA